MKELTLTVEDIYELLHEFHYRKNGLDDSIDFIEQMLDLLKQIRRSSKG